MFPNQRVSIETLVAFIQRDKCFIPSNGKKIRENGKAKANGWILEAGKK